MITTMRETASRMTGRPIAWGIDYRCIQRKQEFERWITVLTALDTGRVLSVWTNNRRPELEEARQVLAFGIAKHPRPDAIWCDAYFAKWVAPMAEQQHIRLHLRTEALTVTTAPIALPNPRALVRHAQRQVRQGRLLFGGRWFQHPALRQMEGHEVEVKTDDSDPTRLFVHDAESGNLLCEATIDPDAAAAPAPGQRLIQRLLSVFSGDAA